MDEGKYQIHNDGPVWVQNVGDHLQIEQTFYLPGSIPAYPAPPEHIWIVPYHRNPCFTGRETLLQRLHDNLASNQTTALTQPQAINGLGGIGKTQVALEYAYRYRQDYRYVFWVRAATLDMLTADFVNFARSLRLPEQNEQDQNLVVDAVKRWLSEQSGWLLILDNADDLDLVYGFLPTRCTGHMLLTTREQVVSKFSQSVEVDNLDIEEGTLMLLRRAGLLAPNALLDQTTLEDKERARAIVQEMGGLPLALDQAGAYIEETRCTLSEYLDAYQQRQADLLKRRGRQHQEYPDSVATTWSLSLERVEQNNPIAAELLRCAAFLAPDDIPEELLLNGAPQLGPILKPIARQPSLLKEAIAELRRFSLVRYHPAGRLFSIHRLVQATLKTTINKKAQRVWTKRVIQAVNQTFPPIELTTWPQCQQYMPHALVCLKLIDGRNIKLPDVAQLLTKAGLYLKNRARYVEAEPLLQRALNIHETTLGPDSLDVARSLKDLAFLYWNRSKTTQQAEPLFQRALTIYEKSLGQGHSETLSCHIDLALLYEDLMKPSQAEQCFQRVLAIVEQGHGPDALEMVSTLLYLADLYKDVDEFEQAEQCYQRVLTIYQNVYGSDVPEMVGTLLYLADLFENSMNYRGFSSFEQIQTDEKHAEQHYQRALIIRERAYGPDHPDVAKNLKQLAKTCYLQGKFAQAKPLFERALLILEKVYGSEAPEMATTLTEIAESYMTQRHFQGDTEAGHYFACIEKAEEYLKQALLIREKILGADHPDTFATFDKLWGFYVNAG